MAIPGPGVPISIDTLNTEFGGGGALSSYYRGGTYVPNSPQNAAIPTSGTIAIGNFYNSSNRVLVSVTASGNNFDVYTNRGGSYVAGKTDLTVTVPAGNTIGSANTASYAMLVPNAFSPTDTVTIVNDGLIQGAGGGGGQGGTPTFPAPGNNNKPGGAGGAGGNALYVNRPVIITNNNTIAGGGGGGGGGGGRQTAPSPGPGKKGPTPGQSYVGGGGGGGAGTVGGGAGGPNGGAGDTNNGGGGGARSTPSPLNTTSSSPGGAGGGRGAVGTAAPPAPNGGTGGGGGAAGYYLVGNSFVTWPATGTRQGNVA